MDDDYNKEKANWDARKDYSQLLRRSIEAINYCIATDDINGWFTALESLINLAERTIGEKKVENMRNRIRKLRNIYDLKSRTVGNIFVGEIGEEYYEVNQLNKYTGELIRDVSDLLLPFKISEDPTRIDDLIEQEVGKL
jgi:hypothetical protein